MKESKADIQEDAVQKLMSEKGAYKNALREKVRLSSYPQPRSFPSLTLLRVRWYLKKELMVGIGNHETRRKAGRPEETEQGLC